MALTLSPELLAAQTEQSRKPAIEVLAGRLQTDFPFTGNAIANPGSYSQGMSCPVFMEDGSMAILYTENSRLKMIVSDSGITEFSTAVSIDVVTITDIDAVLMDSGNIGVVCQSGNTIIVYVVSPTGVKISEQSITGIGTLSGVTVSATAAGYAIGYASLVEGAYGLYLAESADLVNIGAPAQLSISGLTATDSLSGPCLRLVAGGDYMLTFSVESGTIANIYASHASDLSTWNAAAAITDTSLISRDYLNSSLAQKADGTLYLAVQQDDTYLTMDVDEPGYVGISPLEIGFATVDENNGKLYVVSRNSLKGVISSVLKIDIDTWTIDKAYGPSDTIGYPLFFRYTFSSAHGIGSRDGYSTIACEFGVSMIDFNEDAIRNFFLVDYSATYGEVCAKNVDFPSGAYSGALKGIIATEVYDNKLWIWFCYDISIYIYKSTIGYIDLSDLSEPYEFVVTSKLAGQKISSAEDYRQSKIYLERGLCLCGWQKIPLITGAVLLGGITDDVVYKYYTRDGYTDFPIQGVFDVVLVEDYIFCLPVYSSDLVENLPKWGLMRINTNTDAIDYFYPPWITSPGNYYSRIIHNDVDGELILKSSYGVAIFNISSQTWERFESNDNASIPDIENGNDSSIAYSSSRRCFFWSLDVPTGICMVPRDGVASSIKYLTVNGEDFTPTSELLPMATGYANTFPTLAVDGDDRVFASWTNTAGVDSVLWDGTGAQLDLSQFLIDESKISWGMDSPGQLEITLSHGHLFDPYNQNSILNTYLAKGKAIAVKMGEMIDGDAVLVNQGRFIVTGLSFGFKRGDYPTIQVTAQDKRYLWGLHQVPACTVEDMTPEEALPNVLVDHAGEDFGNISVPSIPLSFIFDSQWLGQPLGDIVDDIANRFQYFVMVAMDGSIVFRPIEFDADSTLSIGLAQVVSFSPDDTSSDLTNRITVTGESLTDFEVVYEEEQITSISGTVGWWGYKNDFHIDYSADKTSTYKEPRLEVVESATGVLFQLAGKIKESITEIDEGNKYCVVTVEAPNLVPILASAIALYAAGNLVGDLTLSLGGGLTIPVGRKMEGVGLLLAMMVLGSTGNFQFNIHGRPVGTLKRSYQASADDEDLQELLKPNNPIEQVVDGFLCYSPAHCQTVADFEMAVAMSERNKATVEMITHLQVEVGDTITVTHPYTRMPVKMFVTSLQRAYKPATANDKDGYMKDVIEGWVL